MAAAALFLFFFMCRTKDMSNFLGSHWLWASEVNRFYLIGYHLQGVVGMNYFSDFLEVFLKVIEIRLALVAWEALKKKKEDE